ncbi:transmembrane protein, putative (macronuclear) [Tetrahymena thermophila SB210]|uniref:Transmembrane protein, putative n=1 Tax=Tetrahymena thermophila (strain SB210) TaxID=312017 RepID=I7M0Z5_TETTS|nr:transmembrane protein, putative [Tetrahymena thermophila SB210]EAR92997.2 transmembrane protein, putative [Tetrahymena thermophila SB210]|eukprot:XP_001013242.2 transmembrane protein, putative [Tetrahymena thermophila SB210]
MISVKIKFLLRLKFCLLFSQLTLVKAIGCPFWIAGSQSYWTQVKTMILLKSDPQQDFQDIAAVVYYPFTVGIFNFRKNIRYTTIEYSEDVQFYQIDKDDRQNLQVSVIHTLDAQGRIIGWNSGNGSKLNTLQIPSQIQVNPQSCLNSEELIVVTWDTSNLFIIDYSSSTISDSKITTIQLNQTQIIQCVSDKANRRFLLIDSQGGLYAFDVNSQLFQKLFQIEKFLNFQSIYTTKNQISISYASQNGSFYVSSYKNSVLQFQNTFPSVSIQVLVSQEEDFVIIIGESNLFQVWSIKQNILVYQADFQKIYCDQRDANQTSVDSAIDFTFGSINQKNQISAVSKKYIFVYSLDEKSPLLFKNQALKVTTFKWMQAFVVENQVVVCQEQSVSTLDLKTSKFIYFMDYFEMAQSSYDVAVQIQIDSDFNRIIKVDKAGTIQYWSLFDNLLEKQIGYISSQSAFFIDKSINKLVQYQTYTITGQTLILIYDYTFGILIDNIINPFGQSNLQDFVLIQDKQNQLIIGFVKQTTQYVIYKLDSSLDHSLIFSGVLQQNGFIDGEIILLEQKQQILIGVNGYLSLFNYYYSSGNSNQQINLQNNTDQVISYFYLSYAQTLISIKQQNILIYQQDSNTFNLINILNYNVGQPLQISLVDEKQTLVLNKGNQLRFMNYQNYKEQILNLNDQLVLFYAFDGPKGLLIAVLSNSKIIVVDIGTANTLNQIQIYSNTIQTVDIFADKQLVIVAYNDGQVLLYNYINNAIQSLFNNGYQADVKYLDSKYNTLVLKSDLYMFTRTVTDNCLISQIVSPNKLNSYYIDVKNGLTLMLSSQIQLYNQIKQEYISSSPTSIDLTNSYIIYSIPSQNYLFVGFANLTSNQVIVYELDTYKQIGMLNHNVSQCVKINNFFYDEYLNRLFVGCFSPGTIVVWDLSKNFQLIQVLDQIEYVDRITGIAFNPQAQLIMFLGWAWWSRSIDYYTLNHRCWIAGLFGNFDHTNKLQILWDHNGSVRIYDYNCIYLGYISAHQNWIYQGLIDEQNLILTTISKDRYVKTWNYKNVEYPNIMYEIQLQNPLYDGFLDKDNNYVFVSDFNGFIYVLTYPQLILVRQMQVTNSQINNLYFDSKHNMLIFGSLGSNTIGYYNLIQFMQSNAYTFSYSYVGVTSTLQTQSGIIFYQEGNVVQLWDYKSKLLRYGFYVADLYIDVQSEFILIEGQTSIAALLTREQTVFFDINTLSIINVQKQKCYRNTQIQGYLICSNVNQITILDVNEYIVFQQIQIDKNSSIIELKAIVPLKTFFVTTTQGQVIGYTLNLSSLQLQFNQIFNLQLLSEAIVNSLFIEQSESYILIASSLNGQIAQMVLSQELVILKQQTLLLSGISSHAHILQYSNGYVFIKRIQDFSLNLFNPYDLTLISQVTSPCIGYSYKLDINLDLDYIIQSCLGIYQINKFSTLKLVSYGRFTSTLLQNPTNPVFTPINNKIIFINKDYFIDAYTYQIQTYRINRLNQTITLLGIYSSNFQMLGKVADYQIFDTQENIYAQLILYSGFQIAQIQLPIFGQSICQEDITSDQFAQVLQSIESIYQKIYNYFPIQQLIFNVLIEGQTILPPFPPFQFSNHSQVNIISKNNTTQYKIIASEDLFTSFSGYNLVSLNNLQIQPATSQNDYIQFLIQEIQTFEMINVQLVGNQKLFSFQISSINNVFFQQLTISGLILNSTNLINLFNITGVKQITLQQINVFQSIFNQTTLFYFQDDIDVQQASINIDQINITKCQFNYISDSQYVAPIFISNYFNISFSDMNINANSGVSLPLIKSYLIQNLQLNNTQFTNNQNLMFLQYKKSLNLEKKFFEINQQINDDYIQIQNITLSNNTFNDIQQYNALEIISQTLKITDFYITQNSDFTNQNIIVSIKTISDFNLDKCVVNLNQGFYNLAVIQNQNQGTLQNTEITNNDAVQALMITQSILQILNLKLLNNKSSGLNQLNSIVNIDQKSLVIIKNSTFKNNLANQGGSIFSSQSELLIEGSFFDSDQGLKQGGSIYSTYSNLKINDSQFLNSKSKNGGSIYFENGSLILYKINTQNSQSGESGGFAFINQATQFQISNFSSQYCKAFNDGGVLYITQSNGNNSYILSSIFQNSQALGSGGVILLYGSDIIISKSNFISNTAGIGGVIRYFDLKPQFLIDKGNSSRDSCKTFCQNQCKSNKAIIFGDQIASYPQFASILPSKDFDVDIKNYPNITFKNFRSGQSNFDLTIQFLDEFKNQVKQIDLQNQTLVSQISQELFQEISSYNCRINIQQSSTFLQDQIVKIEGATLVDYAYYSPQKIGCFMNNFKITGVPSKNATIQLSLNGMKTLNSTNQFISVDNIDISIYFRSCQVGEYYNSVCQDCQLQECVQCLNGTYSLIYPQIGDEIQCKSCDNQKASFCELNQIVLRENYWRQSNNSDDIYQCDQLSNPCNGDSTKGYCQEGYTGVLCSSCDDYGQVWGNKYGKVSELGKKSIECSLCSSIQNNSFKQILLLLGIVLYLVFLIIESQNSNCKMCQIRIISSLNILQMGVSQFILQSTVISKIFINQFYVISALKSSIGFTFPGLFQSLFTFPQTTSQPILVFLYSIDCSLSQLNSNIPIQYLRFIYISIVLPCVFLLLIYISINLIFIGVQYFMPNQYYYTQTKFNNANMAISTIIVFSYIASQNIYQAALEIIICEKFGDTYYMKSQMDQECYNTEHKFYIVFLILPILVTVIIIYPITMLYVLCRNHSKMFNNTSTNVIRRYGYFFQGFKRNRWWWEFIKTWYKVLILFLSTYYNSQPQIQLTTVIFVQSIYCASIILFKPYQDRKINKLESKSATYVLLIFWVALFEQLNDDKMYLSFIFSVTLVVLLIMMFGQLAISFIGVIFRRNQYFFLKSKCFLKIFQCVSNKLVNNQQWAKKYLYKKNFLLYNLLFNQEYDPFKVFNNWSKLRRSIQNGDLTKIQIENFQKLIDSSANKALDSKIDQPISINIKSPKQLFSIQQNNSSNSLNSPTALLFKKHSNRQQRQRFSINKYKMNTKSFGNIDKETQN